MKSKLPRLPKLMTHGQIQAFAKDFRNTFAGCEGELTSEGVYNWATQTKEFYDWFYPRFERSAIRLGVARMEPEYDAGFLNWSPYEVKPCFWTDFVMGLARANKMRLEYRACHNAMQSVYKYYLQMFKESVNSSK